MKQPGTAVKLLLIALSLCLLGSACTYKKQYERSGNNYGSPHQNAGKLQEREKMYGLRQKGINNHRNRTLRFRQDLSYEVERIPGIAAAIVMLTDKNAYAAVMLDDTATGTRGKGGASETDNRGGSLGLFNSRTGNSYADPNQLSTDSNSSYTVYDHENIAHQLKQKIAAYLRKKVPSIQEVHISANRGFINRMNIYAVDARKGQNLNRYIDEFNQVAVHYFGVNP